MNAMVIQQHSISELQQMAVFVAQSKLFGISTVEQAFVLMAIAQAEGRPAALAARDYDIIQGRPAKKSEALLRDFLSGGGKVEWHALDDTIADATFSHPQGGEVRITWDMDRAKMAGLAGKDMWKKYPRNMLRSRCVSEGCRTVYPMCTSGLQVTDELRDELPEKDVTPEAPALEAPKPVTLQEVLAAYDGAQDVPSFQRARELAAKLPESDKAEAREKDKTTKARLQKGGESNRPEPGPAVPKTAQPEPEVIEAGPSVTYAQLIATMQSRKDLAALEVDADLMQYLPASQQAEAAAEYHRLRGKLVTA